MKLWYQTNDGYESDVTLGVAVAFVLLGVCTFRYLLSMKKYY